MGSWKYLKFLNCIYKIVKEDNEKYYLNNLVVDDELFLDYNKMNNNFGVIFDTLYYKHYIEINFDENILTLEKKNIDRFDINFALLDNIDDVYIFNGKLVNKNENKYLSQNKLNMIEHYYIICRLQILLNNEFKLYNKSNWCELVYQFFLTFIFNSDDKFTNNSILNELYNELLNDKDVLKIIDDIELYELKSQFNISNTDVKHNMLSIELY